MSEERGIFQVIRVSDVRQKKSASIICFLSAKVQEKQNRKLAIFCSTISLEMAWVRISSEPEFFVLVNFSSIGLAHLIWHLKYVK